MNLTEIRTKVEKSWCEQSSYKPEEWTKDNPAWGQCAVTAKLVYELLGGFISHGQFLYNGQIRDHYWNEVNGFDIDFTLCQFDIKTTKLFKSNWVIPVNDLVVNGWMQERYDIFKSNFYAL